MDAIAAQNHQQLKQRITPPQIDRCDVGDEEGLRFFRRFINGGKRESLRFFDEGERERGINAWSNNILPLVDKLGNSVNIYAEYLKLPPKCGICSEFGHFDLRCPVASLRPVPQETVDKPPSQELDLGTSPAVSKSNSKANPPSSLRASFPALESNSKAGASGGALRRSVSIPGSPVGSSKSLSKNGSSGWVRVGSKSPSKKSTSSKSGSAQALAEPLSSGHFDSEEELISAAQKIIRNRLSAVDTDLPLFSSGPERKKFRKVQRQTMRSLCEDNSAASEDSGVSVNNKFASLTFGSVEAALAEPLSSAHFDSEEELVSAAHKIIRNRLSDVDTDLPLFSSGPERKKFRKVQRQTMRSLCEDDTAASEDSGVSVNNKFASLTFGSVEAMNLNLDLGETLQSLVHPLRERRLPLQSRLNRLQGQLQLNLLLHLSYRMCLVVVGLPAQNFPELGLSG
ncbi:hypothetical protein F2Q68_00045808 [Brassica cretica]|uniref:Uncharacterized protein n=1 Tax=Brassica cretica TaxID=69181 RepID=A0A8S9LFA3_BRACR|nr:hypothetical protein F2Q68_00045808 [Brassica cretica]